MNSAENNTTIVLTGEDIQSVLLFHGLDKIMDDIIEKMEGGIRAYESKNFNIPARSGFSYTEPSVGLVEWMPLFEIGNLVTMKVVGYHPNNPKHHELPTILSTISQYDTDTGHLVGIVDGVLLTALRTGAASAIATRHLSKLDNITLGIIGCGAQAITQVHAISRIAEIERIIYYDVDLASCSSFENRLETLDLGSEFILGTMEEIVAKSDVLCTATSIEANNGPLFEGLESRSHLHINAVGSDFPGKVELPMDIIDRSILVPDFIDQAMIEGECQRVPRERIDLDLTQLVKNAHQTQVYTERLTVFDSTGWALEDHMIMNIFLEYARDLGVGQLVNLECIPNDSKNPYQFVEEKIKID